MPLKYLAFFALNCQWNELSMDPCSSPSPCSSSCLCPVAVPGLGLWRWQQFKTWTATKTCQKSAHLKYLPQSPLRGSQPGRGRNCATWKESQGARGRHNDFTSWVRHLAAIWFSCLGRRCYPFSPSSVGHRPRTWLPFCVFCLLFALGRRLFDCVCVCASVLLPRASLIIYLWLSSLPAFVLFPSSVDSILLLANY